LETGRKRKGERGMKKEGAFSNVQREKKPEGCKSSGGQGPHSGLKNSLRA
jgi:hypothetical protein